MEANVLRRREGIQLSFDLPFRILDTCVYPINSLNGSTIIVCAHEEGLRIIWYAGRRLKQKSQSQVNGSKIDLTEEDDTAPEYEEDDEEVDLSRPFHEVLKHIDVNFGVPATKIAVPPISTDSKHDLHQILSTHIIVLAACADLSLRLVTIPLEPGRDSSTNLQQLTISGTNSHQDLISNVAITVTGTSSEDDETRQARTRSRSRSRNGEHNKDTGEENREWSFLLASTSTTGTGLLLVHQIPIQLDGKLIDSPEDLAPLQRRFLKCSLLTCQLQFNPSPYPSRRHSSLLIAPADSGVTKVYRVIPGSIKKRRDSTATTDSVTSLNHTNRSNLTNDRVLINLRTPFSNWNDWEFASAHTRVLDAKWVLHGRAILVLLANGDWGVWDLEAAGPASSSTTSNLMKGQTNVSSLQGGSLTKFAIQGSVPIGGTSKNKISNHSKNTTNTAFAPMTPHTRKVRSQGLFKGTDENTTSTGEQPTVKCGGKLAVQVQTAKSSTSGMQDESVILNYGSTNFFMPSIQSFWRSEGTARSSFEGLSNMKLISLPRLQTAGEEANSIHFMPLATEYGVDDQYSSIRPAQNLLIATSSRMMLFVAPLIEASQPQTSSLPMRLLPNSSRNQDQMLLDSGELDVDGMERILDQMANSGPVVGSDTTVPLNFGKKSVGFQMDEDGDGDISMETPTASRGSRSKLIVNSSVKQPNIRSFT